MVWTRSDGAGAGSRRPRTALPPRRDERLVVSQLVLRFVATGLVTLVLVAVITAAASRQLGTREAIADANRVATLTAGAAVEPVLTDGIVDSDPAAVAALDRVIRGQVLGGALVRVKIWRPDGTIVYSDESRLIGDRFPLAEDELAVLDTGTSDAELSDLSDPENRFEEQAVQLLEVYLPIRTPGGAVLLFEAYFRYDGVTEAGRRLWLRFAPFSLGALVLLELLQVPLAVSLARQLRRTQTEREALLHASIAAADAERRRIASDLHDGVVQDLTGVALSLTATARGHPDEPPERAEIMRAVHHLRDAVRSLRSLLVEIYPPNLNTEGLEPALSDLMARLEPRGVRGTLVVEGPTEALDVQTTQLLYRTTQEGLRNVVTHARATRATVSLTVDERRVVLVVQDDGLGAVSAESPAPGHIGLRSVADLASSLGGTLEVAALPGSGTKLVLTVPVR